MHLPDESAQVCGDQRADAFCHVGAAAVVVGCREGRAVGLTDVGAGDLVDVASYEPVKRERPEPTAKAGSFSPESRAAPPLTIMPRSRPLAVLGLSFASLQTC